MSDRLFAMLGSQRLELVLGPLVVEKCTASAAEDGGKLRPGVGRTHVDDADRLDSRPRRLGIDEVRRLAGLDASPELLFSGDQNSQIERVQGNRDLDPLAATGDDRQQG